MVTGYVVVAPDSQALLMRGVSKFASALRATLGPAAPAVAITPAAGNANPPELVTRGGIVARRMVELPGRCENMGAMLVRQLACQIDEEVGDGATTAVVLAHAMAAAASKYVAAGGNPQRVRVGFELARTVVLAELEKQRFTLDDPAQLRDFAARVADDRSLGDLVGEAFDIVGPDGLVTLEDWHLPYVDREYVEGMHWEKGYASAWFRDEGCTDVTLGDPRVLVTDRSLTKAEELMPIVEQLVTAGEKALFVVAAEVSGEALSLLILNNQKGVLRSCAVGCPSFGQSQMAILEDIAVLTGARVIAGDAGERLATVRLADLGRVRRAWANHRYFSLVGGGGDATALRKRIAAIKAKIPAAGDEQERQRLRERLGKLVGGVAIVKVGAGSAEGQKRVRALLEQTIAAVRLAQAEGVVPGGGMAYLACVPALERMALSGDEGCGVRIVARALAEPLRCIARNGGREPGLIVATARSLPPGWGFDVLRGEFVDMGKAGIVDPLAVAKAAVSGALSTAAMILTSGALVCRPEHSVSGSR